VLKKAGAAQVHALTVARVTPEGDSGDNGVTS
jgi:hypothetical protein